ncbi:uncharacterized protein LOC103788664 [Callithrix jacchus]
MDRTLEILGGERKSSLGEESRKSRAGRAGTQLKVFRPQSLTSPSFLAPGSRRPSRVARPGPGTPARPFSDPRPAPLPSPPPSPQPGSVAREGKEDGLTRSLRAGRRRGPVGRRPAAGVPLGGFPQVILEAHLPGFAAAREPPQAVGSAPQQAPALPGERGQVVHAAAGPDAERGPRRSTVFGVAATTSAPTRQCDPTWGRRLRAPHKRRGGGGGRSSPGPGTDHQETMSRGSRRRTKVFEKFFLRLSSAK